MIKERRTFCVHTQIENFILKTVWNEIYERFYARRTFPFFSPTQISAIFYCKYSVNILRFIAYPPPHRAHFSSTTLNLIKKKEAEEEPEIVGS